MDDLKISTTTCIHCSDSSLVSLLYQVFNSLGLRWNNEEQYSIYSEKKYWEKYRENTIYYPYIGIYGDINFKDNRYDVISAEDFLCRHGVLARTLTPFDVELAKQGANIVTSSGKRARIICYDRKNEYGHLSSLPIVALVEEPNTQESVYCYDIKGINNDIISKKLFIENYIPKPIVTEMTVAQIEEKLNIKNLKIVK